MTGATRSIRTLTPAEVDTAVDWAAREGWNPGLADAAAFLAQDAHAFRGLFLDGALAAVISATRYAGGFAFVGFYICRPDLRGEGHGLALWEDTFRTLDGPVGLDAVVEQQATYARDGFKRAYANFRFGGTAPEAAPDPRVVDITPAHLPAIETLDRACFGFPRPAFLKAWLAPPQGRACVFVQDGAVKGYGVIRRCRTGWKIGPLFADDATVAGALFSTLARTAAGDQVFLDIPDPNPAARALAEGAGLAPVFETGRMYRGTGPDLPLDRIFGITTFELG